MVAPGVLVVQGTWGGCHLTQLVATHLLAPRPGQPPLRVGGRPRRNARWHARSEWTTARWRPSVVLEVRRRAPNGERPTSGCLSSPAAAPPSSCSGTRVAVSAPEKQGRSIADSPRESPRGLCRQDQRALGSLFPLARARSESERTSGRSERAGALGRHRPAPPQRPNGVTDRHVASACARGARSSKGEAEHTTQVRTFGPVGPSRLPSCFYETTFRQPGRQAWRPSWWWAETLRG
jgi:hypothetical protein